MPNEVEILLVEDNEADIELTLHALRGGNLSNRILVARDGEEALEFLKQYGGDNGNVGRARPRLILLDLKLPKVDGFEVLRYLKADPKLRLIPVVILTSSREERDLATSYELGTNSYIQKPVDFEQFRETVKNLGLYWLVVNQTPSSVSTLEAAGRQR